MSIGDCRVFLVEDDFVGVSQNRMDAVLMLAIESNNAMMKRGRMI